MHAPESVGSHCDVDQSLFQDLYLEHRDGVQGLATRLCGGALAGDVAQEVFINLWEKPERFDPNKGSVRSLLMTMTHDKAVDVIRREDRLHKREQRMGVEDATNPEFDAGMINDDVRRRVMEAIDNLPAHLRQAIVTAYYGRHTYREAAEALGQPEGTIKARIRAGLALLRVALADLA